MSSCSAEVGWASLSRQSDGIGGPFKFDGTSPGTVGEASRALVPIVERFIQDRVDVAAFGAANQPHAHQLIASITANYCGYLRNNNLLDFSSLEEAMLSRRHPH